MGRSTDAIGKTKNIAARKEISRSMHKQKVYFAKLSKPLDFKDSYNQCIWDGLNGGIAANGRELGLLNKK